MKFTIVIEKSEDGWYVGQLEEVPAAISQGKTIEECKANVLDALLEIFDTNRELIEVEYRGRNVIKDSVELVG
ncbi:MAG: type II toxin-antitoxin system HicB family antitoxin [Cyclobacteriaceae bacterium]|jgi:predicted RNase H-like HicB family nuclease|nr:type II toxin-antitoxin system HicB family antitoxin [Cyclobacteriaceae bacterium]WKZ59255.1 MAG: type II toxin-antitoxin system HicB family antitoxin [Cyclobacteriaceae bacterium]